MATYKDLTKSNVLDIGLSTQAQKLTLTELVDLMENSNRGLSVHFLNSYNLFLYDKNPHYKSLIQKSDVAFCDGRPLYLAAKIFRIKEISQIRGPGYFSNGLEDKVNIGIRHFFIGGDTPTKNRIIQKLNSVGGVLAGFETPPFRDLTQAEYDLRDLTISESSPQVIWVGLGTPKQDMEVSRLSQKHKAVVIAVGAAFDFYAGTKKEAPGIIQKLGLEWCFRLLTEPKRLWKRYLFGNSYFLYKLSKKLLSAGTRTNL